MRRGVGAPQRSDTHGQASALPVRQAATHRARALPRRRPCTLARERAARIPTGWTIACSCGRSQSVRTAFEAGRRVPTAIAETECVGGFAGATEQRLFGVKSVASHRKTREPRGDSPSAPYLGFRVARPPRSERPPRVVRHRWGALGEGEGSPPAGVRTGTGRRERVEIAPRHVLPGDPACRAELRRERRRADVRELPRVRRTPMPARARCGCHEPASEVEKAFASTYASTKSASLRTAKVRTASRRSATYARPGRDGFRRQRVEREVRRHDRWQRRILHALRRSLRVAFASPSPEIRAPVPLFTSTVVTPSAAILARRSWSARASSPAWPHAPRAWKATIPPPARTRGRS